MRSFSSFRRSSFSHTRTHHKSTRLYVEELEARNLLSVFTPTQIRHAYGFDQIFFNNPNGGPPIHGDGTGQTIAIVDAYDHPKIESDLQAFNNAFGLPNTDGLGNPVLTKVYAQGSKPAYNSGWAQEIALDVEWAHAIAPGAHILLVEAANNSFANLFAAVDYARQQPGVVAVSLSWGSPEFSGETAYDQYFTTPIGHGGVTFVASSGDKGAVTNYPAVSPNVVAVGGTSLTLNSAGDYLSEKGWSGSGGGVSAYESKPVYQGSVTLSATKRTSPDIAYNADPNTGVYVYFTAATSTTGSWYAFGGTSAGAPQIAALVAIADQGRALNGLGSLDGASQTLPALYQLPSSDYHDVTSGTTKNRNITYTAKTGYDLITGLGTPTAAAMVRDLMTVTAAGTLGSPLLNSSTTSGGSLTPAESVTFTLVVSSTVDLSSTSQNDNNLEARLLRFLEERGTPRATVIVFTPFIPAFPFLFTRFVSIQMPQSVKQDPIQTVDMAKEAERFSPGPNVSHFAFATLWAEEEEMEEDCIVSEQEAALNPVSPRQVFEEATPPPLPAQVWDAVFTETALALTRKETPDLLDARHPDLAPAFDSGAALAGLILVLGSSGMYLPEGDQRKKTHLRKTR